MFSQGFWLTQTHHFIVPYIELNIFTDVGDIEVYGEFCVQNTLASANGEFIERIFKLSKVSK